MVVTVKAWLNDLVIDARWLQELYVLLARGRASWARRSGEVFKRVEALLQAWRLLGSERFGSRRSQAVRDLIAAQCFRGGQLIAVADNPYLSEFQHRAEAQAARTHYANFPFSDRIRFRYPRPDDDPERQGDLMVLKAHDPQSGEKGVLFVMYDESIRRLPAIFDMHRLAQDYMIVLEPSWWGYQDSTYLLYLGADLDVVVLAQCREDHTFLEELRSNIAPLRLGAGDWVDPTRFRPREGTDRAFDLVMVSAWNPIKRHKVLFQALRTLKARYGESPRVALIGYPQQWTRDDIVALMRSYGVEEQCTTFENIPHAEVARIVADSKAYVLLSRREGANRGLYESLFCDTPVIVYRHHRGVNLDVLTEDVGVAVSDSELPEVIRDVVRDWRRFKPLQWAMANSGWQNSTRALDGVLESLARRGGRPWTRGIAGKMNSPNLMYAEPGIYKTFVAEYDRLATYMVRDV